MCACRKLALHYFRKILDSRVADMDGTVIIHSYSIVLRDLVSINPLCTSVPSLSQHARRRLEISCGTWISAIIDLALFTTSFVLSFQPSPTAGTSLCSHCTISK